MSSLHNPTSVKKSPNPSSKRGQPSLKSRGFSDAEIRSRKRDQQNESLDSNRNNLIHVAEIMNNAQSAAQLSIQKGADAAQTIAQAAQTIAQAAVRSLEKGIDVIDKHSEGYSNQSVVDGTMKLLEEGLAVIEEGMQLGREGAQLGTTISTDATKIHSQVSQNLGGLLRGQRSNHHEHNSRTRNVAINVNDKDDGDANRSKRFKTNDGGVKNFGGNRSGSLDYQLETLIDRLFRQKNVPLKILCGARELLSELIIDTRNNPGAYGDAIAGALEKFGSYVKDHVVNGEVRHKRLMTQEEKNAVENILHEAVDAMFGQNDSMMTLQHSQAVKQSITNRLRDTDGNSRKRKFDHHNDKYGRTVEEKVLLQQEVGVLKEDLDDKLKKWRNALKEKIQFRSKNKELKKDLAIANNEIMRLRNEIDVAIDEKDDIQGLYDQLLATED